MPLFSLASSTFAIVVTVSAVAAVLFAAAQPLRLRRLAMQPGCTPKPNMRTQSIHPLPASSPVWSVCSCVCVALVCVWWCRARGGGGGGAVGAQSRRTATALPPTTRDDRKNDTHEQREDGKRNRLVVVRLASVPWWMGIWFWIVWIEETRDARRATALRSLSAVHALPLLLERIEVRLVVVGFVVVFVCDVLRRSVRIVVVHSLRCAIGIVVHVLGGPIGI